MLLRRDYSLLGTESERSVERGLAKANWYRSEVPPAQLETLRQRDNQVAIRDTLIWFGVLIVCVLLGMALWPSWWSVPFWLVYGVLYGSASESRWHECGHGTAFATNWMNEWVYQIASFMALRNPTSSRHSHIRHHQDTNIVGLDPEIAVTRPPAVINLATNLFAIPIAFKAFRRMFYHLTGRLDPEEACYVPQSERRKVFRESWVWLIIYVFIVGMALTWQSLLPLMIIGFPSLYGAWYKFLTGFLYHAGLAEDVLDYRLNTRTYLVDPISQFLCWNMNYHIEHHMFPSVPYHARPRLHELIKHDLPEPDRSIWQAYMRVIPVLLRQLKGDDVFLVRRLPNAARTYRADLHDLASV